MNKISMTYLLCLTLFSTTVFAQTPKENLAKGIDTYNALREYSRTLTAETLTDENMGDVKNRVELGTPLFDKVVKEGTADQIRVARYFKANLQYELAYMYALKGDNDAAYDALKALENSITTYKSSDFPMTYDYSGKIFKITWENFAAVQAEYFTTFGEISYNLTKYEDAYASMKNVLATKNASAWLRYTAVNKILDIRTKNKALISDDDYPNFSLKSMKTYADLSAEDKKTVVDNNYPTWERGYKIFNNSIDNVPNSQNLTPKIGEAALILRGVNENEKAAKFFTFALKNGWGTTMIWKNDVLPTAKITNDKVLGINVLGRLVTAVNVTDCEELDAFARDYAQFGDVSKSAEMKKKGDACRRQKEAEAKRLADEKQAQEERRARENRRANRDAHFFVGVNLFPLFAKPTNVGGVVNFGAKKTLIELAYLSIAKKKENFYDLELRDIKDAQEHKWDGFFTHVALKYSPKGFKRILSSYSGLLVGYGQRTFEPFSSNVTNKLTNKTVSKAFNPTNKQYIGMVNFGYMTSKLFGIDMYLGLGAAYNQFDGGNVEVWNNDNFTIEDKMVGNRKANYFSFIGRIGVSIGFGG
jgi:hypothetical protein